MRRFSSIALGTILLLSLSGKAHARTEIPSCTFETQPFASLQKSKASESVQGELHTRKTLLQNVLNCLDEEVRADRVVLERTKTEEPSIRAVRNNFLSALEDTARFYESQRESVANAGLRSAKDIAANAREWRTNTYIPQQTRIHAFATWANNEEFLATAGRRLEELTRNVQLLRLVDVDEIQNLLEDANRSYRTAVDFHARARAAFLNGLDPATPIKLSLEALAKTYHSFIEMSDTINSLLPHGKEKK